MRNVFVHLIYLADFCTPADEIVVLHVPIFIQVDCNYFAPEQQTLHQHPAECSHEEQMK